MADLVIHSADALVTDWREQAVRDGWILVSDGTVEAVGTGSPPSAQDRLDASGMVVVPGFVAAHHHLYQGVSRGVHAPGGLLDWLDVHYRAWSRMTSHDVGIGAEVSIALAIQGGCTTVAGFEYLHPPGEDFVTPVVEVAKRMGIRLVYVRGCAPRLEGALSERLARQGVDLSRLLEPEEVALARTAKTLDRATDGRLRWAAGPTTPVVDDGGAFHRALDEIAVGRGTHLHTHFHPIAGTCTEGESAFGMAQRVGLVREGNWIAHGSQLTPQDVAAFGTHGVGVVHNPSCSALLGYPTPPLRQWMTSNDRIAVSVDGSASNDRGGMLAEVQLAWQMQRARYAGTDAGDLLPRMVLDAATRGAARAINWEGLGTLSPGSAGDIAVWSLSELGFAGSPASAAEVPDWLLLRCYSGGSAAHVFVGGEAVLRDGVILGTALEQLIEQAHQTASRLYGHE